MISVGIDSGSATTKAVLVKDGKMVAHIILPTAFEFLSAAEKAYKNVLAVAGVDEKDVEGVYATGYGRNSIQFANKAISEITAHAISVHHFVS